ncbi:MAG: peptidylprolyl isomerase [archaeon]
MPAKKTSKKKTPDSSVSVVKDGSTVKFHYIGKLESGEIFDKSEGRPPLEFVVGKGLIIPGLEKEIMGMKAGGKKTVKISSADAYGEPKSELIRELPKGPVPEGMKLEVGTVLYLKTPDGHPIPVTVKEVKGEMVVLDFNHPLSGKNLIFDIEIMEVA